MELRRQRHACAGRCPALAFLARVQAAGVIIGDWLPPACAFQPEARTDCPPHPDEHLTSDVLGVFLPIEIHI
jgi:hypothetical protein